MSEKDPGLVQIVIFFRELQKQRLAELAKALPASYGAATWVKTFRRGDTKLRLYFNGLAEDGKKAKPCAIFDHFELAPRFEGLIEQQEAEVLEVWRALCEKGVSGAEIEYLPQPLNAADPYLLTSRAARL